ncbi:MAG: hypothetical protein J0J01_09215 [Reyranella sp.]|uniref:hypothetical protein n=1 Tax=Reyranella sp. TaxID=1929291 RepID=UPI001AD42FE8|nr:hypothetical protein [Reyranella sp.]MBN9087074.1 hypothetical protein [Reyranella sp.]
MITIRLLALLLAASLPVSAMAQSADTAYCNSLIRDYYRYVVKVGSHSPNTGSLDGQVAVEQCRAGNTAAGIPVLEQKLRGAGVSLPARG